MGDRPWAQGRGRAVGGRREEKRGRGRGEYVGERERGERRRRKVRRRSWRTLEKREEREMGVGSGSER